MMHDCSNDVIRDGLPSPISLKAITVQSGRMNSLGVHIWQLV